MKEINFKKRYTVYGLNIESEIEIEELKELEDNNANIDVNICYGKTPGHIAKELNKIEIKTRCSPITRNDIWLTVNSIANYNIKDGNNIIIDPIEGGQTKRIKSFLLGWAFGILFTQRNTIAIHGSTIVIDDSGIIIAGDSGVGKSTLSEAFKRKGYCYITDDLSVIDTKDKANPLIKPAYPLRKLCTDAMDYFGYDKELYEMTKKNARRERYKVNLDNKFLNKEVPLKSVFIINIEDVEDVKVKELKGREKIDSLMDNGYFLNVEANIGMRPEYFMQYLNIAKNINVYKLIRPIKGFTVKEQVNKIEEILVLKK